MPNLPRVLALPIAISFLLLGAGCGGGSSPTDPGPPAPAPLPEPDECTSQLAGTYTAAYNTACPNTEQQAEITVTQTGCAASFSLPGYASFDVAVDAASPNMQVTIAASCEGGLVSAGRLDVIGDGTFGLVWGASSACCAHGAGLLTPVP